MTPRREHWFKIGIALVIGFSVYAMASFTWAPDIRCSLYDGHRCILDAAGNMARLK